jgi:hypothetical protein
MDRIVGKFIMTYLSAYDAQYNNDNTAVLISEAMWEDVMMKINSNMHSATLE